MKNDEMNAIKIWEQSFGIKMWQFLLISFLTTSGFIVGLGFFIRWLVISV